MACITELYPPMDLDEIVEVVNSFDQYSIERKFEAISDIVSRHPFLSFPTKNDTREFYRARVSKNRSFPFSYKGLVWNHSAPSQGSRLNAEGDVVLYVANQANAALSEVGADDDFVIMSTLRIQAGKSVRFLPIGTLANIMRSNSAHLDFTEEHVTPIRSKMLECPFREMQSLLIADEFIYNCIMAEDKDYIISSKTASLIFKRFPDIDAISYPSKKFRAATNYAIKTNSFWDKWEIRAACSVNVKHLALGHFMYSDIRSVESIDDNGLMAWERSYSVQARVIPLNWKKS